MSAQLTPSKRPNDGDSTEVNGKGKQHKSEPLGSKISPVGSSIRFLCPVSRLDSVIGEDGSIILQIHQETGAKVRVEENVPGCDERVITIGSSVKENEVSSEQEKVHGKETDGTGQGDDAEKRDNNDEDKCSASNKHSQLEKNNSSVQKALLLLFQRMFGGDPGIDGGDKDDNKSSSHVMRLLVPSIQVGSLLGKGGSIIKLMSSESGAQIRILPRDKLPSCISSSDDLVQVSGELDSVRKAVLSISQHLLEFSHDQDNLSVNSDGLSSHDSGHPFSRQDTFPPSNHSSRRHGPSFPGGYRDDETGFHGRIHDVLAFRLLCPDEKVGGIIGKGGNIIKALQHETGCEIKVLDAVADSEDRVIIISGPVHPDERVSPVQDAVLRVQSRILRSAPESKEKTIRAKLLVSSNQIGCLLGKGGSIIAEMRKSTGAYIRILGKEQIPKCATENEEVVQINGELEAVQDALMQITARLRGHFFRDAFPAMNGPAFLEQMPPFPPYMGRRDLSPRGMYPLPGPHGGIHPHDDHPPFMHDFHRPGIPPHVSERMPPAPWGPQGMIEGGGQMGLPDYTGAHERRISGSGGGNHPAFITCTTVEVVVPSSVVPAIYGEDGGCLRQICEISDAKITITDTKPGDIETLVIISGTPEQTNAAQSLIQAFVISETEAQ